MRQQADALRSMPSSEAADWLLQHYPLGGLQSGIAVVLMEHLSLQRTDWSRLARHYLAHPIYAHDRPYRLFSRVLGIHRFLAVPKEVLPANPDRHGLLRYHLGSLLRDAPDRDRKAFEAFMAQIAA